MTNVAKQLGWMTPRGNDAGDGQRASSGMQSRIFVSQAGAVLIQGHLSKSRVIGICQRAEPRKAPIWGVLRV